MDKPAAVHGIYSKPVGGVGPDGDERRRATGNSQAQALKEARKKLGLTGFVPIGGITPDGQKLMTEMNKNRNKTCPRSK
jgi:hypothetical protein